MAVTVTELKARATQIMREVAGGEEYVVLRRGRPVGVILPVTMDDLEDWVLAHHPEAVRRREEGRAEIARGEYATAEELRAMLREAEAELERNR